MLPGRIISRSIMETILPSHPDLRREFGKVEDQMMRQQRVKTQLTPVLGVDNDQGGIFTGILAS
jgi:hypothetical protein